VTDFGQRDRATKDRGDSSAPAPKITTQYRSKLTMVYELESRGFGFEIRISRAGGDAEPAWHVEAHNGFGDEVIVLAAEGATASDALSAVARSWRATGGARGLVDLDWEAVARVLGSVRAL
jgi:hypothetical protein